MCTQTVSKKVGWAQRRRCCQPSSYQIKTSHYSALKIIHSLNTCFWICMLSLESLKSLLCVLAQWLRAQTLRNCKHLHANSISSPKLDSQMCSRHEYPRLGMRLFKFPQGSCYSVYPPSCIWLAHGHKVLAWWFPYSEHDTLALLLALCLLIGQNLCLLIGQNLYWNMTRGNADLSDVTSAPE